MIYEYKNYYINLGEVTCIGTNQIGDKVQVNITFAGCSKPSLIFDFDANDFELKAMQDLLQAYFEYHNDVE